MARTRHGSVPHRLAFLVALGLAISGCGLLPSERTATQVAPPPAELPGSDAGLPRDAVGATGWIGTQEFPTGFDAEASHATPDAVADSFIAAFGADDLSVETFREVTGRSIVLVTQGSVGDDSVHGRQFALVIEPRGGGWSLAQLYARALCRRGVDVGTDRCV